MNLDHGKIRQLRQERGYSLKEMSKMAGISISYLSEIESGVKIPSLPTLDKLAAALRVPKESLIKEESETLSLGDKLRVVRKEKGISMSDLAKQANISPSYLSEIERGNVAPSVETLKELTGALDLSLAQLMGNDHTIGHKLRLAREQYGLTQAEVAERAGVSAGLIGQIEQGKVQPSLRTIEKIAAVLHTSPCFFIVDQVGVENMVRLMGPELRSLLTEPKVQAVLRLVSNLSQEELRFVFGMIQLLKQSRLEFR